MNERENVLAVYRHQASKNSPVLLESIAMVGEYASNEQGKNGKEIRPGITLDNFGCEWDQSHGQPMNAQGFALFDDIVQWREKVVFPSPKSYDWDALVRLESEKSGFDKGDKAVLFFDLIGVFDRLTACMGFEKCLMALVTDPEECRAFFEAVTSYKLELMECAYEAMHPDIWTYHVDVCHANGLLISPQSFRALIKPYVARIVDAAHSYGMIAEIHTCGKFDEIVDDYIEIGVDSIMPSQAQNDLAGILNKYGDKFVISGGWDSSGAAAMSDAPEEVIRAEARRCADEYGRLGSYVFMAFIGGVGVAPTEDEITRTAWAIDEYHKECERLGL